MSDRDTPAQKRWTNPETGRIVAHPYERSLHSGAGNCWCGRGEMHRLHLTQDPDAANPPESMEDFIVRLKIDDVMPPAPPDPPTSVSVARIAEQHPCLYCGKPSNAALHSDHKLFGPRWLDLCMHCYMLFVQASNGRK